ncbi:N-acetylmuramoyl-L-alanine amidase [Hymenobacter weizhouensis]|uniref:N-acetylmuramoyl-L-alanine amidase n=1 Tax=Hymenobacter sp. YIM 151500-1 TaxID=2987689 RepID=UPI002226FDCC|nr:N-acetylmuramoyl-L-alanine amidase [Hymenobacter sp. YIM 151500-1]UYZ61414.1 N-acetylmuramoyl-L-alanine amidase [Hymenobacter sp. YIM 151500-1]
MKTLTLFLLLLCLGLTTMPGLRAQELRPGRSLFAGEGQGRVSLPLASAESYADRQDLAVAGAAARPAPGKAAASFTTRPIAVGLTNPKPFVVFSLVWRGENLAGEALRFAVRTSRDGLQWSAWQPGVLDGHADDDATRRVSRAQELAPTVRFVQVRAEVAGQGATPVLSQLEAVFYSPGETPAAATTAPDLTAQDATSQVAVTCAKPVVTSRAGWGARTPTGTRSYTTVTHLVVHHEAGSNTSSDWAARVRAVESLHIDANGWSDVGYNYLIDPNGVVYEGRSGGDNVIGAHFCGGNANTMAVCMLGDYSSIAPTTAARESLKKILAWKAARENINPLGSSTHYAAGTIPNVCGHRDNKGCTACPGNVLYGQLPTLRADIQSYLDAGCGSGPVADTQAPTTSISAPATTVADDFTATFTDADNVGVAERFYQVLENTGAEWRANRGNGFFNDNFVGSTINTEWTIRTGQWILTTEGRLKQANTTLTNTNISTALTQGSGQTYLYNFAAKLNNTTGSRRFGFHIMASDVTATERGNSYLVWFSADDQKVRIIETVSNVLNERASASLSLSSGTWSDYKATYNTSTGTLNVYVNNSLKLSWTDTTPLTSGTGFTLRTNQAEVEFDDLKVYKSRSTSKLVTVGPEATQDARRRSPSTTTAGAKIKSLVRDAANNWSSVGNLDLVVSFPAAATAARLTGSGSSFGAAVYPNPLPEQSARVSYHLARAQPVTVTVTDLRGKPLLTLHEGPAPAGDQLLTLPSQQLPRGLYLLRVRTADGTHEVLRLLKQ